MEEKTVEGMESKWGEEINVVQQKYYRHIGDSCMLMLSNRNLIDTLSRDSTIHVRIRVLTHPTPTSCHPHPSPTTPTQVSLPHHKQSPDHRIREPTHASFC